MADAQPIKGKAPKYTTKERDFANQIFPAMEDAGIIVWRSSPWGARTLLPPKKKGSQDLRVVHNFIPVKKFTTKSSYPIHRLEEVLDIIIKPRLDTYMTADAANGYWAVPMKESDCNKTGVLTPNGSWVYKRMGQGLKGTPHTYSMFSDLVFGPLPASNNIPRQPTIIGHHGNSAFSVYMDDHVGSAKGYDAMFNFLHEHYFPRVAFGPVYLAGKKTKIFDDSLQILGYEGGNGKLRPSEKHWQLVREWPIP